MPLTEKIISRTHALQLEQRDCGVACLLNLTRYYGGNSTIDELRRLSGTSVTGTTLLGLKQAAEKTGFDAEGCEADIPALIEHGQPVILHVLIEDNLQHYIAFYGKDPKNGSEKFVIGDPAKGIIRLTREELEKIWVSKACLTLTPNENFTKKEVIKKRKREWIINLIKEDYSILGVAALLGLLIATLGLSMAVFSQKLIDVIIPGKNLLRLNMGIVLLLLLLLAKEGFSYLRQYLLINQSQDFNIRIIDYFYSRLLNLRKLFFDTRKIGELTARMNDTARIQRVISQIAGTVIADIMMVIASLCLLFVYKWEVAVACLLFLPLFFILIRYHNKSILTGQRNVMAGYAQCESNYISTIQGIETIKNFNKQELFSIGNKELYENFQSKVVTLGRIQIKLSFLASSSGVVFLVGVLFYCANLMLYGKLLAGELIAITGMCGALLPGVANLALISIPINEAKIAFDRMFEFTGIEPEQNGVGDEPVAFRSIEVKDIAFRFAGRSKLLKGVSFSVSKGEIVAIMGENGCGKSTLAQILLQHYQQESGSITLNESRLQHHISLAQWRKMVGSVPQNIHIFNGTVLENIAFDDASANPQGVIDFIKQYGLAPFIDSLPQSFMTLVGEEGINLSGGQKQMIALARALYQRPQLLILDEVTSSMDRNSEQFVLQLLKELKCKMGIIFITHRLHVLKGLCDRIYIMGNGKIEVQGNHEKLLQSNNLYSQHWFDLVK
jgi:ATP-binding cassette, subfamily C, bacteriocin exporter